MGDTFLNFQRFRKALTLAYKHSCRKLDLDMRLASILKALDDLGPSSAVELCRATSSDPAEVNRAVAESVKNGWIKQVQDPHDRRCSCLTLTPGAGKPLAQKVSQEYARLAKQAFEPFNAAERKRFNEDLKRLTAHLTSRLEPANASRGPEKMGSGGIRGRNKNSAMRRALL